MKNVLFSHLRPYAKECVLAPVFKLLEVVFELLVPLVVAAIVDVGIAGSDFPYIIKMVVLMFLLGLAGLAVSITAQYFSAKAATCFAHDVKRDLFKKIQALSAGDVDAIGPATLLVRMTNDMNFVQSGLNMTLRLLLRSPFVVLGAAVMAFLVDFRCALIFAVAIPLLALAVWILMAFTVPRYKMVQHNMDKVLSKSRENLYGSRVIRAFCLEEDEDKAFLSDNASLLKSQIAASRISSLTNPLTSVIINFAIIVLIYYGAIRVDFGYISQGALIALVNYMSQILTELIKLANLIITISKALASARRVEAVFETPEGQKDGDDDVFLQQGDAISFDNVSFRYFPNAGLALDGISFSIGRGKTLGVIGGTGSGKSTLACLLMRLYDPSEGKIEIHGKNILSYRMSVLRSHVAMALQKARLFSGTIESNLRSANPLCSQEDIKKALETAQAWDFVQKKGLSCKVESGGKNFSGGQRQRLSVARAVLRNPDILILDDSSSALDYATEASLRTSLSKLSCTKVIISQRASSVMDSDLILVLDQGRLAASGTHDELLKNCEIYRQIYHTQFKEASNV